MTGLRRDRAGNDSGGALRRLPRVGVHRPDHRRRGGGDRLPDRAELTNHVGSQHAGALFTVAEAASGAAFLGAFADRLAEVTPLARSAEISYEKIAKGPIEATRAGWASARTRPSKRSSTPRARSSSCRDRADRHRRAPASPVSHGRVARAAEPALRLTELAALGPPPATSPARWTAAFAALGLIVDVCRRTGRGQDADSRSAFAEDRRGEGTRANPSRKPWSRPASGEQKFDRLYASREACLLEI